MSIITKIKVLDGGKGQAVNPFDKPTESDYYKRKSEGESWGDYLYKQWHDFDKANPAYDIISPLSVKVGETVDATLAYQYKLKEEISWTTDYDCMARGKSYDYFEYQIKMISNDFETRLAWQLTPEKEGEEKKISTKYQVGDKVRIIKNLPTVKGDLIGTETDISKVLQGSPNTWYQLSLFSGFIFDDGDLELIEPIKAVVASPDVDEETDFGAVKLAEYKINKYATYVSNLQWHLDNNATTDLEKDSLMARINCYKEIIGDLREIIKR